MPISVNKNTLLQVFPIGVEEIPPLNFSSKILIDIFSTPFFVKTGLKSLTKKKQFPIISEQASKTQAKAPLGQPFLGERILCRYGRF